MERYEAMVTFEVICALDFELWECFRLGKAKTKGGFKQKMPQVKLWFWNEYCWDQRLLPNKKWWEIRDGWLVGNWVAWICLKQSNGTLRTNIENLQQVGLDDVIKLLLVVRNQLHERLKSDVFWSWHRRVIFKLLLQSYNVHVVYISPKNLAMPSPNLSKPPNLNWGHLWTIQDSFASISQVLDGTSSAMKPGCGNF